MEKPKRNLTPEEYEKDKQVILKSYKSGLPQRRMVANFGYTKSYINNMKRTLITEGLITEEEIKTALAKYLEENPPAQGLDKSKARKPKGTGKAEKRHSKSVERKEEVFRLVKQGYTKSKISKMLGIIETTVGRYIKSLIEERQTSNRRSKKGK